MDSIFPPWIAALVPPNAHDIPDILESTSFYLHAHHVATLEALHVLDIIKTQLRVDPIIGQHGGLTALLNDLTVVVKPSRLFLHDPMCDVHPSERNYNIHLLLKSQPLRLFQYYAVGETLQYIAGVFTYFIKEGSECPTLYKAHNMCDPLTELSYLCRRVGTSLTPSNVACLGLIPIFLTARNGDNSSRFQSCMRPRINQDRYVLDAERSHEVIGICISFSDPISLWKYGIYPRPFDDLEVNNPYAWVPSPLMRVPLTQVRSHIMPSLIRHVSSELLYWDSILAYPSFMRVPLRPSMGYSPSQFNNEHEDAYTFTVCMKFSTALECAIVFAHDLVRGINKQEYEYRNYRESVDFRQLYVYPSMCMYCMQGKCHTSPLL